MIALADEAVRHGHEVHGIFSNDRADPLLVEELRRSGAVVHTTPMRRPVGPWDAADGLALRQLLRKLGSFDVLHSHSSKAGVLTRVFGRGCARAQVYSPHGFYTMTGQATFYVGPIERSLSLATDRLVAVSSFERDHALSLGIAAKRVAVIPNGLRPAEPLPRADARAQLGLDPDAFVIGFVGRLEEQKDVMSAVSVMAEMQGSGASLAIIGEGPLRAPAEERATTEGLPVRFLGAQPAKALFRAFDVLLCTSRYEGMPVAFLESLNAGTPIVSYPVGGTAELIENGRTGFVIDPEPTMAAAAIKRIRLLRNDERLQIAQACRDKAAQHTDRTMGEATLALYRDLLG
jgi:glycosyltransferase involved in cell wall biosynthesis